MAQFIRDWAPLTDIDGVPIRAVALLRNLPATLALCWDGPPGTLSAQTIAWHILSNFPDPGLALPPSWGPEDDKSFRDWCKQVLLWRILTDMDPARQCASVMLQLRGAASDLADLIPLPERLHGAIRDGQWIDGLTLLMSRLGRSLAPME